MSAKDSYPYIAQRKALDAFLKATGASPSTHRKDDCGDPIIKGTKGHVIAAKGIPWIKPSHPGFMLYVEAESPRAYSAAKKALSFATGTQDGDEEGFLWLPRLPTTTEAQAIRRYLGIHKRRVVSAETKARLLQTRKPFVAGGRVQAEKLASKVEEVHP